MAMNWLKGLVAPAAQFAGQQMPQQMPGGPPIGGFQQQPMMPAPDMQQQQWQAPQWSSGTRTQGQAQGVAAPAQSQATTPEARVEQLQHDVESLALFARTLLTMLEERNVITRAQFDETKKRLDMLDGKLDDR